MTLKVIINDKSLNVNKSYKIVDTNVMTWLNNLDDFISTTNKILIEKLRRIEN